jgi:hypothetical protein
MMDNMGEIKLDYNVDVSCMNCSTIMKLDITKEDFTVHREERSLGYEYDYEYIKHLKCTRCDDEIVVGLRVYEYPRGFINYSEPFGMGYFKNLVIDEVNRVNKLNDV